MDSTLDGLSLPSPQKSACSFSSANSQLNSPNEQHIPDLNSLVESENAKRGVLIQSKFNESTRNALWEGGSSSIQSQVPEMIRQQLESISLQMKSPPQEVKVDADSLLNTPRESGPPCGPTSNNETSSPDLLYFSDSDFGEHFKFLRFTLSLHRSTQSITLGWLYISIIANQ